jgi:hypothetical protein
MEGGEGKNKGGAICINKLLEGGAINFFQENEGGVAIKFERICLKACYPFGYKCCD